MAASARRLESRLVVRGEARLNKTVPKRSWSRKPLMPAELRPTQALRLWHDVTLDLVRDGEHDLSARQMAVLLTVYLEMPPHTVRGLAAKLGVTKPAITRALDTMGRLGLVSRHRDPKDRRNVVVQRTVAGALAVERLGDVVIARHRELPL
jgi:DNA-binding MarR family transcriptional regulator